MDNLQTKKAVEVECNSCSWYFWLDPMDDELPDGPFVCGSCKGDEVTEKAAEDQNLLKD